MWEISLAGDGACFARKTGKPARSDKSAKMDITKIYAACIK